MKGWDVKGVGGSMTSIMKKFGDSRIKRIQLFILVRRLHCAIQECMLLACE